MKIEVPGDLVDLIDETGQDRETFVMVCVAYGLQVRAPDKRLEKLKRQARAAHGKSVQARIGREISTIKQEAKASAHIREGIRALSENRSAMQIAYDLGIITKEDSKAIWDAHRAQFERPAKRRIVSARNTHKSS